MRKLLIGVGALLLLGSVALLVIPLAGTGSAQTASATTRTATVQRTTLYDTVEGSGSVTAEQVSALSFEVAGTVTQVLVEMGDEVTEGQVLAVLDTGDLEYDVRLAEMSLQIQQADYDEATSPATAEEIAQAEAQLAQALSQLESAQADLENVEDQRLTSCASLDTAEETLADAQTNYDEYVMAGYDQDPAFVPDPDSSEAKALANAQASYDKADAQCRLSTSTLGSTTALEIAQANYDQTLASYNDVIDGPSETELLQAEVKLQQSQLQLEQAQDALDGATLYAPYDGVVTAVNIVVGQEVSATTMAITVADTSRLHIDVSVDELDVTSVEQGLQANITLQALDNLVVTGSVRQIAPSGSSSQGLVTYTVRVDMDTTVDETAPGDTAAAPAAPGGFVPAQGSAAASGDTAATAGSAAALGGMGQGGMSAMREIFTAIQTMGGAQAVTAMLAEDGGEDTFYAQLTEAGVSEEAITALKDMGGPAALIEMMANGPMGQGGGGFAGGGQAGTGQSATTQATAADLSLIRLGMTADVEVIVNMEENVLVVSTSAIQRDTAGTYVMVDDGNGGQTRVAVTPGTTKSGMTVIEGDISEGAVVYIPETSSTSGSTTSGLGMGGFGALTGGGGMGGGQMPAMPSGGGMPAGGPPGG